MSKKSNNIRVMCRFRPMNDDENRRDCTIIHKTLKKNGTMIEHPDKVHHPQPMTYYFDKMFDKKSAQVEIFEEAAMPLIDNIFQGYNATIFAYGQTGAGKTHTMMGDIDKSQMHPRMGIIPRVVREIWNRIVHASTNCEFELKVSFLEIYNEQIFDLLSTTNNRRSKKKQRQKLIIREYSDQVYVENLTEIYVRDQSELFDLIKSANKQRISAATAMNRTSSRSHAVLTIILGQEDIRTGNSKKSKFCLVDLAGSEKVGKTQAKGIRLKEATSINKSLTTLGTCMSKLAENMSGNNQSMRHIPFRESVLTRLLSDSLGGNCKTTLIICCSPSSFNVEETMSTLRFGERAKKIKTKARINQIKTPQQYRKELQAAQTEIMKLYRIIEDCAFDIQQGFKGTLNVENCKSYKKLLDLKKYTLNILNGNNNKQNVDDRSPSRNNNVSTSLLANILPDLSNLQSLKKVNTVKKQQKKMGVFIGNNINNTPQQPPPQILQQQRSLRRQLSNEHLSSPSHSSSLRNLQQSVSTTVGGVNRNNKNELYPKTPEKQINPRDKLLRARCSSFEELDVDNQVSLVRNKPKKVDPLKKKKTRSDFKVTGTNANVNFQPPGFDMQRLFGAAGDGLSLGQMSTMQGSGFNIGDDYNSGMETSDLEYNSEFDNLGIMSPAPDGTQSDASNNMDYSMFKYDSSVSDVLVDDFDEFQEEELPKNFFEMTEGQRERWANSKNLDPLLVNYRFLISREIDWESWNSDDEQIRDKEQKDKEIENMDRIELEKDNEFHKARLLMLCRLLRTKSQEFESRVEIEVSRHSKLYSHYRSSNEKNQELMRENRALEKEYEVICNEKREILKTKRTLNLELQDTKKKLSKLEKQLTLTMNELNIERTNQVKMSNNKTSMLRKKVHEKYRERYRKIENEVINNDHKDLDVRFNELAKAFKSQSMKYQDLEEVIENSKQQIAKLDDLMQQKEAEKKLLSQEIEDGKMERMRLMTQHNSEVKQIRDLMKKTRKRADEWKRRAFTYKTAVNTLMEQQADDDDFEDEDLEEKMMDDLENTTSTKSSNDRDVDSDNPPSFKVDILAQSKLKPLHSFSPRSQLGLVEIEKAEQRKQFEAKKKLNAKSPRFERHRKSRMSIDGTDQLLSMQSNTLKPPSTMNRGRHGQKMSKFYRNNRAISPTRNEQDPFHMTPSQKAALTSVKTKIRGGGGSDEDVYRTPIKTHHHNQSPLRQKRNIRGMQTGSLRSRENTPNNNSAQRNQRRQHQRNISQPLNASLPKPTGYSSDDMSNTPNAHIMKNKGKISVDKRNSFSHSGYSDKSRSAVPIIGIDNFVRNKSSETDDSFLFDQSPSANIMNINNSNNNNNNSSPRGSPLKKGQSPLPPPPRGVKQRTSMDADVDDSDDANDSFEADLHGNDPSNSFLSPHSHQSPAGSFFSKIKHRANDQEDDYKMTNIRKSPIQQQKQQSKPRRRVVSMPEPSTSDEDELGGYSDVSNTDDNVPSYRPLPSASNSLSSIKGPYASGVLRKSKRNILQNSSLVDNSMD